MRTSGVCQLGVSFVSFFSPIELLGFWLEGVLVSGSCQGFHVGVEVASVTVNLARGWVT